MHLTICAKTVFVYRERTIEPHPEYLKRKITITISGVGSEERVKNKTFHFFTTNQKKISNDQQLNLFKRKIKKS